MDTDLDYGPEDVAKAFEAYPRLTKESWSILGNMFSHVFPPEWFSHVFTMSSLSDRSFLQ